MSGSVYRSGVRAFVQTDSSSMDTVDLASCPSSEAGPAVARGSRWDWRESRGWVCIFVGVENVQDSGKGPGACC